MLDGLDAHGVGRDRVVIALLDSGTNPYLPVFALSDDDSLAQSVAATHERIILSAGGSDLTALRKKDEAVWQSLGPEKLYHFVGTRVLAISFDHDREYPYTRDAQQHGSATSYLAAREAPEAIILMVQFKGDICGPVRQASAEHCPVDDGLATAMEWVAAQDWIDVVTISYGIPANLPTPSSLQPAIGRYLDAVEAAHEKGMLVLAAAGNEASRSLTGFTTGPPMIVSVGGVELPARGENVASSRGVDVVANFTDFVPMFLDGEHRWRSGTSLAAPIVAGTLGRALHLVREAEPGRVTAPGEMRDALNASASYFNAADWDPRPTGREPLPFEIADSTSLPILLQAQMGWGYVNSSFAPEIARRVLDGDVGPSGKDQASRFQPEWQKAREEWWSRFR